MKTINGSVNWGIIGCGDVCEIKSGPAFSKIKDSRLVAVMRRDKEKARDFAERHNVDAYYYDADDLINDSQVNAIYIATPPSFHEEYTIKSIAAGKPVYIEKPVSVNSPSVERMIEASATHNIPVSIAHYRRALPLFQKVRSVIEDGTIGQVQLIMIKTLQPAVTDLITQTHDNWRVKPELSGGGLFHDLSPHQLDILIWIFGKPTSVYGQSVNQLKQYRAPDVTSLEMIFPDNIFFQGLWAFNMPHNVQEDNCKIIGSKGSLSFSFFRNPGLTLEVSNGNQSSSLSFSIPPNIQHPMIEKVVRYFKGEGENPCSLNEALLSMQIMDATVRNY